MKSCVRRIIGLITATDAKLDQWRRKLQIMGAQFRDQWLIRSQQEFLNTQVFPLENPKGESLTMGKDLRVLDVITLESFESCEKLSILCADDIGQHFLVEYLTDVKKSCSISPCPKETQYLRTKAREVRLQGMTLHY